jgi:hypothetical protein
MTAPFPSPVNMTNYTAIFEYANTVTDSWFVPLFLIALLVVIFLSLIRYDFKRAGFVSFFITFIVSAMVRAIGLVPDWWIWVPGVGLMIFGLILWWFPE